MHDRAHRRGGASPIDGLQLPVPAVRTASSNADTQETRMAKTSSIEKNKRRRKLTKKFASKRSRLKAIANDRDKPLEERFDAAVKLAALPRNGSATRIRNRCNVTGRARGYYRKLKMSRIAIREFGAKGLIPGLVKSSW